MDRRTFIQALSAFLAVATSTPGTIASQPIDWRQWNDIELHYADGAIRQLLINARDLTDNREARLKLAGMLHLSDDGIFIGDRRNGQRWGCEIRIGRQLPDKFAMGFQAQVNESGPSSFAVNGSGLLNTCFISDVAASPFSVTQADA